MAITSNGSGGGGGFELGQPGPAYSPSHTHLPRLEVSPPTGLVFGGLPTLADGGWPSVVHGAMRLRFNHIKKGCVLDSPA